MAGRKGMITGGQNRLPTQLKELRGTLRAHRTNKREPKPVPGVPRPAKWLSNEALVQYWSLADDIKLLGVGSVTDGKAMALTAQALADVIHYDGLANNKRLPLEDRFAAQRLKSDAWRRAHAGLRGFGLDAVSRSSVSTTDSTATTQPDNEGFFQ